MKKLEIYIHIPFCVRKCAYCDFLSAPAGREIQEQYFEALKEEIRQFPEPMKKEYAVTSVFFGGGTPSIVPAEWIAEILGLLREKFAFADSRKKDSLDIPESGDKNDTDTAVTDLNTDNRVEISLECNPGTADESKFQIYRKAGVNRISFGLQSADNRELHLLGRIHSWEEFVDTYHAARRAGFDNINVDLMSALPGQTVQSWEDTLRKVLELKPEHISAYSLIIEEGTPFYEQYEEDAEKRDRGEQPELLPSEDDERRMYELTEEILKEHGMHRYEISNYALQGRECRHNIGYWDGTEYIGFGLGSSSMVCTDVDKISYYQEYCGNREKRVCLRIKNPENLSDYLQKKFSQKEITVLTEEDQMSEFMFVGLRMMRGVSEAEFRRRFGKEMEEIYGEILKKQQSLGLLARENGSVFLTAKGIDVSNMVMAEYLL